MGDVPMDDTGSAKPDQPFEYFTGFTFDAAADPQPEETELSMDGSGPPTPTQDTDPFEESDEVQIIKPYDIEEPDDDLETSVPRVDLLCLPDPFEGWQRELTDYLNGLDYEHVGSDSNAMPLVRKRGKKRKPANNALATQQCQPYLTQGHASAETQPEVNGHSPKRRKFSELSKWHAQDIDTFGTFREANANESSGSETASIDLCGGNDGTNNSPMADEMDID
ncbi:unnamed protein product [Penicillium nalgiovense]|uniref:Uncharacterized protein n=2 Tax=Penicillium nalgiovense TaxID=60175 RepID=A0A9W4MT57_PENNA|nr:unnamed protein product [Penicillium nalgiovense]CAG7987835.1 unnamed protein product [Penicillium nalgiovense]CAG7991355.1 unnamed protein product [Penicillium nalgiovense]CAG8013503.1 unnamed protein product [Penicillium nalgiovense]CAG8014438.1 unnamed protein product [Penicillium nalgiovense]